MFRQYIVLGWFLLFSLISFRCYAFFDENSYGKLSLQSTVINDADAEVAGVKVDNINFSSGLGFGASLGYHIPDSYIRIETEVTLRSNDLASGSSISLADSNLEDSVKSISYMLNLFADIPTDRRLSPYIGLGVGIIDVWSKEHDYVFGYQLMGGVQYELLAGQNMYLGYRFLDSAEPEYEGPISNTSLPYRGHVFEAGYKIRFGSFDDRSSYKQVIRDVPVMSKPRELHTKEERYIIDEILAGKEESQDGYFLQVGIYNNKDNALQAMENVEKMARADLYSMYLGDKKVYKIRVGPIDSKEETANIYAELKNKKYYDVYLVN